MRTVKTLPHASKGWYGGTTDGGTGRVLYVTDVDLKVEIPEISLELEEINIMLEVEIDEVELEDD